MNSPIPLEPTGSSGNHYDERIDMLQHGAFIRKHIVDFESVICTKIGVIKFLFSTKTIKKEFFNIDFMNYPSINLMKNMYVGSEYSNPLMWVLQDEYKDSADSLYEELMENYYEEILNLSVPTTVLSLIEGLNENGTENGLEYFLNCRSDLERKIFEPYIHVPIVTNNYNMDIYDAVIVPNLVELEKYNPIAGKNIYIHNINSNYKNNSLKETMDKWIGHSVIHTVDPFKGIIRSVEEEGFSEVLV